MSVNCLWMPQYGLFCKPCYERSWAEHPENPANKNSDSNDEDEGSEDESDDSEDEDSYFKHLIKYRIMQDKYGGMRNKDERQIWRDFYNTTDKVCEGFTKKKQPCKNKVSSEKFCCLH